MEKISATDREASQAVAWGWGKGGESAIQTNSGCLINSLKITSVAMETVRPGLTAAPELQSVH